MVPKAKQFRDFRVMFDKMAGDIDAVQVAIPDFAHFPVCMAAMQLGKSVFVEKPMCRTFLESEMMARMAEKNPKLITQVGNQGHSGENYFQIKAWKEAGIIRAVTAVTAFMNGTRRWHPYDPDITRFPEVQPLPKGMTDKDWKPGLQQPHTTISMKSIIRATGGAGMISVSVLLETGAPIYSTPSMNFLTWGSHMRLSLCMYVTLTITSSPWNRQ
jgi:hypothetical protein